MTGSEPSLGEVISIGIRWVLACPGVEPWSVSISLLHGFTHFKPLIFYSQLMVFLCLLHRNHLPSLQTHLAPLLDTSWSPCQFTLTPALTVPPGVPALSLPVPRDHLPSKSSCLLWSTSDSQSYLPSLRSCFGPRVPCLLQSTALDCLDLNLDFGILDPNAPYLLHLTVACHHDSLRSSQLRLALSLLLQLQPSFLPIKVTFCQFRILCSPFYIARVILENLRQV